MYRFAEIQNNKVVNIIVSEHEFASTQGWILAPDNVGIDFDYIDNQFIDNRPVPEITAQPEVTKEQLLNQLQELTDKINKLN